MGSGVGQAVLQEVGRLFGQGNVAGRTDADLLARFLQDRDELAFQALLARHGPMVLAVCRHLVGPSSDVDDAFQATFLILVRRAGSLRQPERLGPWLYGVAHRVAARARVQAARRAAREAPVVEEPAMRSAPALDPELSALLHAEINRLPEKYRDPIILCYLEGHTHDSAAAVLTWPVGTVRGRLARARELLRTRLGRRGITLPAAAISAWLVSATADAAVPARLIEATTRSAQLWASGTTAAAGGLSASVAHLVKGVLHAMTVHQVKQAAILLVVLLSATSAGVYAYQAPGRPARAGNRPAPPVLAQAEPAKTKPVPPAVLKYHDGQPDGKKSIGGSGELIEFTAPSESAQVTGLRIHGSRYGMPQAPNESFLMYFLSQDRKRILATEMAPYALFERGGERWVEVKFDQPVEVPKQFWVALDFRAAQTKGVYLSYDASTGGKHSRVGLPGTPVNRAGFGDWMVEVLLGEASSPATAKPSRTR